MDAREIFNACVGVDEEGENKAAVKVETSVMHRNDMTEESVDEVVMDNPVVDIFQSDRLTIVNLKFSDPYDDDFLALSKIITDFQTFNMTTREDSAPIISLAAMPKGMNGYYVMGVGGVAVLQPSKPGELADTASFIFTNDTIAAYLLNTDEVEAETEEKLIGEE